jgi:hypothetical protein
MQVPASIRCVDTFLHTSCCRLPALYLFQIDKSKTDNDRNAVVTLKYGISNNLKRRAREHVRTFGPSIDLCLHTYVDPIFQKDAECDVKRFFKETGFDIPKTFRGARHRELAIVPISQMPVVRKEYARIGALYMTHIIEAALVRKELRMYKQLLVEKQMIIDQLLR